jgi:acyl-CoA thioester hydrolase
MLGTPLPKLRAIAKAPGVIAAAPHYANTSDDGLMDESSRPSALQDYPIVAEFPIQWGDLDAYGHVNNVVYLKWFESARAIYASRVGVEIFPNEQGIGAVLSAISCKFLRQLSFPGDIYSGVRATRLTLGGVSLEFRIVDAQLGTPVAEGTCDAVLYDYAANQPVAVPDAIRTAVEQLEGKSFEF